MPDRLSIDVDLGEVLRAVDALDTRVVAALHAVGGITAHNVTREAQARVRRLTGQTARSIRAVETRTAWFVIVDRDPFPNLPLWIEEGTVHQDPAPFIGPAIELEEGPHHRRAPAAATSTSTIRRSR